MSNAPPLRLFVDPTATPVAIPSLGAIPHHWVADVKAGLDRDERLGVIDKLFVNEPLQWCSRMVICPKGDGSPRRVIDYSQLNKFCPRQTHHTKAPWAIASSILGGKIKSVLDNWNNYHSVPIHPADRPLTTFLTPFGRYQYRTCPQGLLSAEDGYTQRMDLIVGDLPNKLAASSIATNSNLANPRWTFWASRSPTLESSHTPTPLSPSRTSPGPRTSPIFGPGSG